MAALGNSLSASSSAVAATATPSAAHAPTPAPAPAPASTTATTAAQPKAKPSPINFVSFPPAFKGFGVNGTFGEIGVKNGTITIVEPQPNLAIVSPSAQPQAQSPADYYLQQQEQQQNQPKQPVPDATTAVIKADPATLQVAATLSNVREHIAGARATGDTAAAAQLQPKEAALSGALHGQPFAGVGSTPPKPFAKPEVPSIFLNFAA